MASTGNKRTVSFDQADPSNSGASTTTFGGLALRKKSKVFRQSVLRALSSRKESEAELDLLETADPFPSVPGNYESNDFLRSDEEVATVLHRGGLTAKSFLKHLTQEDVENIGTEWVEISSSNSSKQLRLDVEGRDEQAQQCSPGKADGGLSSTEKENGDEQQKQQQEEDLKFLHRQSLRISWEQFVRLLMPYVSNSSTMFDSSGAKDVAKWKQEGWLSTIDRKGSLLASEAASGGGISASSFRSGHGVESKRTTQRTTQFIHFLRSSFAASTSARGSFANSEDENESSFRSRSSVSPEKSVTFRQQRPRHDVSFLGDKDRGQPVVEHSLDENVTSTGARKGQLPPLLQFGTESDIYIYLKNIFHVIDTKRAFSITWEEFTRFLISGVSDDPATAIDVSAGIPSALVDGGSDSESAGPASTIEEGRRGERETMTFRKRHEILQSRGDGRVSSDQDQSGNSKEKEIGRQSNDDVKYVFRGEVPVFSNVVSPETSREWYSRMSYHPEIDCVMCVSKRKVGFLNPKTYSVAETGSNVGGGTYDAYDRKKFAKRAKFVSSIDHGVGGMRTTASRLGETLPTAETEMTYASSSPRWGDGGGGNKVGGGGSIQSSQIMPSQSIFPEGNNVISAGTFIPELKVSVVCTVDSHEAPMHFYTHQLKSNYTPKVVARSWMFGNPHENSRSRGNVVSVKNAGPSGMFTSSNSFNNNGGVVGVRIDDSPITSLLWIGEDKGELWAGTRRGSVGYASVTRAGGDDNAGGSSTNTNNNNAAITRLSISPTTMLQSHNDAVSSMCFCKLTGQVVSGSLDGTVWIFDSLSEMRDQQLRAHDHGVTAVEFSENMSTLLTGGFDDYVNAWADNLWHAPVYTLRDIVNPFRGNVVGISVIPSTPYVGIGDSSGTLRVFDLRTRKVVLYDSISDPTHIGLGLVKEEHLRKETVDSSSGSNGDTTSVGGSALIRESSKNIGTFKSLTFTGTDHRKFFFAGSRVYQYAAESGTRDDAVTTYGENTPLVTAGVSAVRGLVTFSSQDISSWSLETGLVDSKIHIPFALGGGAGRPRRSEVTCVTLRAPQSSEVVAMGHADGSVSFYSLKTSLLLQRYSAVHDTPVVFLSFHPTEPQMLSVSSSPGGSGTLESTLSERDANPGGNDTTAATDEQSLTGKLCVWEDPELFSTTCNTAAVQPASKRVLANQVLALHGGVSGKPGIVVGAQFVVGKRRVAEEDADDTVGVADCGQYIVVCMQFQVVILIRNRAFSRWVPLTTIRHGDSAELQTMMEVPPLPLHDKRRESAESNGRGSSLFGDFQQVKSTFYAPRIGSQDLCPLDDAKVEKKADGFITDIFLLLGDNRGLMFMWKVVCDYRKCTVTQKHELLAVFGNSSKFEQAHLRQLTKVRLAEKFAQLFFTEDRETGAVLFRGREQMDDSALASMSLSEWTEKLPDFTFSHLSVFRNAERTKDGIIRLEQQGREELRILDEAATCGGARAHHSMISPRSGTLQAEEVLVRVLEIYETPDMRAEVASIIKELDDEDSSETCDFDEEGEPRWRSRCASISMFSAPPLRCFAHQLQMVDERRLLFFSGDDLGRVSVWCMDQTELQRTPLDSQTHVEKLFRSPQLLTSFFPHGQPVTDIKVVGRTSNRKKHPVVSSTNAETLPFPFHGLVTCGLDNCVVVSTWYGVTLARLQKGPLVSREWSLKKVLQSQNSQVSATADRCSMKKNFNSCFLARFRWLLLRQQVLVGAFRRLPNAIALLRSNIEVELGAVQVMTVVKDERQQEIALLDNSSSDDDNATVDDEQQKATVGTLTVSKEAPPQKADLERKSTSTSFFSEGGLRRTSMVTEWLRKKSSAVMVGQIGLQQLPHAKNEHLVTGIPHQKKEKKKKAVMLRRRMQVSPQM